MKRTASNICGIALCLLVVLTVGGHRVWLWHKLRTGLFYSMTKLQPGMTEQQVLDLIPRRFGRKMEKTNFVSGYAYMVSRDARSAKIWRFDQFCPGSGAAVGDVYFDENNLLVGAYYSASGCTGGLFRPKWGVRIE